MFCVELNYVGSNYRPCTSFEVQQHVHVQRKGVLLIRTLVFEPDQDACGDVDPCLDRNDELKGPLR